MKVLMNGSMFLMAVVVIIGLGGVNGNACIQEEDTAESQAADPPLSMCERYTEDTCCTAETESAIDFDPESVSDECRERATLMACIECHPDMFAYFHVGGTNETNLISVCDTFCDALYDACANDEIFVFQAGKVKVSDYTKDNFCSIDSGLWRIGQEIEDRSNDCYAAGSLLSPTSAFLSTLLLALLGVLMV